MGPESRNPVGFLGIPVSFLEEIQHACVTIIWSKTECDPPIPASHVPSSYCPQNQNIQNINLLVERSLWVPNTVNKKKIYINQSSWNFRKPLESPREKNQVTLIRIRIRMVLDSHWQLWGNGFEFRFLHPAKLSVGYEVRIKSFKNSESLSPVFLESYGNIFYSKLSKTEKRNAWDTGKSGFDPEKQWNKVPGWQLKNSQSRIEKVEDFSGKGGRRG